MIQATWIFFKNLCVRLLYGMKLNSLKSNNRYLMMSTFQCTIQVTNLTTTNLKGVEIRKKKLLFTDKLNLVHCLDNTSSCAHWSIELNNRKHAQSQNSFQSDILPKKPQTWPGNQGGGSIPDTNAGLQTCTRWKLFVKSVPLSNTSDVLGGESEQQGLSGQCQRLQNTIAN